MHVLPAEPTQVFPIYLRNFLILGYRPSGETLAESLENRARKINAESISKEFISRARVA